MTNPPCYTWDTQCMNCELWFAIVEYPDRCPCCNSRNIKVMIMEGSLGHERPQSHIEHVQHLKRSL